MPGVITLANIAIGYDAKQLKNGIDLSRKDLAQLQKNLEASLTPMQRFQTEIQALQKAVAKGALGSDKAGYERTIRAVNTIAEKYKGMLSTEQARIRAYEILGIKTGAVTKELEKQLELEKKLQRIGGVGSSGVLGMGIGSFTLGGMAASAGWKIFSLLTDAVNSLTIGSIKLAAEIESTSVAFEVLTGSSSEALSMLTKMRELDKESPLNFMSIQRAGKTLLGYGVQAKQIMPSLEALSKISMGNSERFELLSLAFAQVASRGKIAGDEVRQMVNQGFNPLMAIAEKMAREQGGQVQDYMDKLRKYMEQGVLSFELMQVAIQETTTGTGKFAKMNERMVETVSGQWNKLLSNWQVTQQKMGEAVSPVTMFVLKNINEILESKDNPVVKLNNLLNLSPLTHGGTVAIANRLVFGDTAAAAEQARKKEKERKEEEEKKKNKTAQEMIDEKREFERKEAEKKKLEEEQQRVKDKLQSEVDKLDEKIAGEARRLGMSPRQAALDERFFDLMKEVSSVFGANSVEVKKLNGLMQQSGKQFDKELKMKEQEIQSEAKKKQAERQDRFNKWFLESINPDDLTSAKTELLQKDSVEAYKFLIKRDDAIEKRKQQIAEEQKKLQEDNNEILKRMQEDLKDAPRLVKI